VLRTSSERQVVRRKGFDNNTLIFALKTHGSDCTLHLVLHRWSRSRNSPSRPLLQPAHNLVTLCGPLRALHLCVEYSSERGNV